MFNIEDNPIGPMEMFMAMNTINAHIKDIVDRGSSIQKRKLRERLEQVLKQLEADNV